MRMTRIATLIPEQEFNSCIPINYMQDTGNSLINQAPYIILKWNNCNASTSIGTMFVTTAMSF